MTTKVLSPDSVYQEYKKGVEFNNGINLYANVRNNENFFIGKQWEGVKSNGLPTPQFNMLKRVVLFSVANVSTDNLKLHASGMPSTSTMDRVRAEVICKIVNDQFAQLFEMNNMGSKLREFTRDAAVDGDGFLYTYFDDNAETGQPSKGFPRTEVLDNTQVMFGNPNSRDLQSQPYILVNRRLSVEQARDRAEQYGQPESSIEEITADTKETEESGDLDELGGDKVTVILKLWRDKKTGSIHGYECTRKSEIRGEWDMNLTLYPLCFMSWDFVKDCYHGMAMITGLIPNQIFVNKLFAMAMLSMMTTAFPKIIYDGTRIKVWDNRVGRAIKMNGGDVSTVAKIMDPAAISPQISQFIDLAVSYTQKFLGASDVALGDTRPDNTSAIVALQRASAVPSELSRQNLLQAIEDCGRIYLDFMKHYYGKRYVEVDNPMDDTQKQLILFDFSELNDIPLSIKLDAGASSYWSEIATMQTLDNLLMNGKIDTVQYLERLPAGQITDRETLIAVLKAAQAVPPMGGSAAPKDGEIADNGIAPPILGGRGNGTLQRAINKTGTVPNM